MSPQGVFKDIGDMGMEGEGGRAKETFQLTFIHYSHQIVECLAVRCFELEMVLPCRECTMEVVREDFCAVPACPSVGLG